MESFDEALIRHLVTTIIQQVENGVKVLKKLEWSMGVPGCPRYAHGCCPICGAVDDTDDLKHEDDCKLANALKKFCRR